MQPITLSKAPTVTIAFKHSDVYKLLLHLFITFESNCLLHKQLGEECDEKRQNNLHLIIVIIKQ